jgi:hypothetical protein
MASVRANGKAASKFIYADLKSFSNKKGLEYPSPFCQVHAVIAIPYFFFFFAAAAGFAFAFAIHSPFSIATRYAYNEFSLPLRLLSSETLAFAVILLYDYGFFSSPLNQYCAIYISIKSFS